MLTCPVVLRASYLVHVFERFADLLRDIAHFINGQRSATLGSDRYRIGDPLDRADRQGSRRILIKACFRNHSLFIRSGLLPARPLLIRRRL